MLALALALSLSATPSVETQTTSARLIGEPAQPARSSLLLAQADLPPPLPPPDGYAPQGPTLQELRAQYATLEASKPRIGGWIAMMSVGTPVCALFTYFTVSLLLTGAGSSSALFGLGPAFVVFTGVIAGIGLAAAVVGTIMLIVMAVKGGRIGDEMEALRQRINVLERSAPPAPPPGYYPPPPPPPPPAVQRETETERQLISLVAF
jgi:hypothetical protein